MKTICYVDGYNMYYGCLKNSPDKWLDIKKLFDGILHIQNPESQLLKVKFFTAPIKANVASHGTKAQASQQTYHNALKKMYPECLEIINGYYSLEKATPLKYITPPDKAQREAIWKLEEKQTDVNIAITAYRDIAKQKAEQLVFVSNDTDLVPALAAIREDYPDTKIGVIIPIRENSARPNNKQLSQYADWTRNHIKDSELSASHLPDKVPTHKKPIRKPDYW
ncbi:MAG: NYN domain-containing protein [Thiotrichaceae bacterium]|nr:NYN domain-containing protein [Thiotrichaceae bacterium]